MNSNRQPVFYCFLVQIRELLLETYETKMKSEIRGIGPEGGRCPHSIFQSGEGQDYVFAPPPRLSDKKLAKA